MQTQRGERGCRGPSGEILSSFRKPWGLGRLRLKHSFYLLPTESLELRGIGLLCFFYGIRESIEILVYPSFCLSPSHMVLSLVSYFLFFFKKFLSLGDKIGHLNKVLFWWVKRFLRARNHSKKVCPPCPRNSPDFSKYLLPNFLVLLLDVFWFSIVRYWIFFAILLLSSPELPLPWTSTHY